MTDPTPRADPLPTDPREAPSHLTALLDLRVAVEIMDTKITPYGNRADGTVQNYIVADSTWHRVLAVARGSVSEAARKAIDDAVSCLACGQVRPLVAWHRDRPDIGICEYCRDARRTLQVIAAENPDDPDRCRAVIELARSETEATQWLAATMPEEPSDD